jgi:4-hydroxybenzoate decarboxylase
MRAYQDLREYLSVLDTERQLIRVTEQVNFEPDLAAAACALTKIGESVPAIQFSKIAGCADAQVVMNVHGSWPNHALALGMDKNAPLRIGATEASTSTRPARSPATPTIGTMTTSRTSESTACK